MAVAIPTRAWCFRFSPHNFIRAYGPVRACGKLTVSLSSLSAQQLRKGVGVFPNPLAVLPDFLQQGVSWILMLVLHRKAPALFPAVPPTVSGFWYNDVHVTLSICLRSSISSPNFVALFHFIHAQQEQNQVRLLHCDLNILISLENERMQQRLVGMHTGGRLEPFSKDDLWQRVS